MKTSSNILSSSLLATLGGVLLIAAALATSGGNTALDKASAKGDRFATVGEEICSTQSWPNISAECVAWRNGDPAQDVRYITLSSPQTETRSTILTRVAITN